MLDIICWLTEEEIRDLVAQTPASPYVSEFQIQNLLGGLRCGVRYAVHVYF